MPIKLIARANRLSRAFAEGLERWARRQDPYSPGGHGKRSPKSPKPPDHVPFETRLRKRWRERAP